MSKQLKFSGNPLKKRENSETQKMLDNSNPESSFSNLDNINPEARNSENLSMSNIKQLKMDKSLNTLFKAFDLSKQQFEKKQSQLLNYLISQLSDLSSLKNPQDFSQKIEEVKSLKSDASKVNKSLPEPKRETEEVKTTKTEEVNFLLLLKQKLKLLQTALEKERADKLKLSKMLRDIKNGSTTERKSLSPIFPDERRDPRLSFKKTTSMHNNMFNFSTEKSRHRYTMIGKPSEEEELFTPHEDMNNSMRKSLDETSSRLEEKYGEKFWQNQVQRVIKQSQNYSMLYNTKKRIGDKEKQDLQADNERLTKKLSEIQQSFDKIKDELELYKKDAFNSDNNKSMKKKFVMKPKRKLQPPTNLNEDPKTPTSNSNLPMEKKKSIESDVKNENDDKGSNRKESKTFDYVSKTSVKEGEGKSNNSNGSNLDGIRTKNELENNKLVNTTLKL
jgi:hypothetical protein